MNDNDLSWLNAGPLVLHFIRNIVPFIILTSLFWGGFCTLKILECRHQGESIPIWAWFLSAAFWAVIIWVPACLLHGAYRGYRN